MTKTKFSFIIPFYNGNVINIESAIESIRKQNIPNYEIILVNDGSTDKTINDYCAKISEKHVKYFYQKNSGSAVARNTGLNEATGDYIMFVDADDILSDNFFHDYCKKVNGNFDFLIFDYSYWDSSFEKRFSFGKKTDFISKKNDIIKNILFYPGVMNDFMFGSIWAKCFSRKYLNDKNIRFKPELRKAQDRRFMLDIIYSSSNIIYYPIYSYKYRTNNISICHTLNYAMYDYYKKLYNSVNEFVEEKKISHEVTKFFGYNIVNELLPLSTFNIYNTKSYLRKRNEFIEISNYFRLKSKLKDIKYSEIPTLKGKIKLFCYKHKLILFLYLVSRRKQKNIVKKGFG